MRAGCVLDVWGLEQSFLRGGAAGTEQSAKEVGTNEQHRTFFGMNKLAVGTGRLTGFGGRFFGAPSLATGGGPELDVSVDVIGAVDTGGTDTVGEVTRAMVLVVGMDGGLLGGSLESTSIVFVDGKAVFNFAAFAAEINSFGVLYPSSFAVDSTPVAFQELVRAMKGAGCASAACALKVAGVA